MARVALFIMRWLLRAIWVSAMVLTPLFGFWLASSLAAYHNAAQWFSLVLGLLLFPILPVGWELFHGWRRSRRPTASPPILTRLDRLVLRTLIINGLFLGGMMWQARHEAFRALAVRGDWMLDGCDGALATRIRGTLLGFADRFDHRTLAPDRGYGKSDTAPATVEPERAPDPASWPLPTAIDPIVANMPASDQVSIEAVGGYLAARIVDKRQLVKAIHDYVITRLHYDDEALAQLQRKDPHAPDQSADAVFARRAGVCAGYAHLMSALGKAAGVEIAYITGYIRDSTRRLAISDDPWDTSRDAALEGVRHAWNAARIDDHWYLIDATWDDPTDHSTTTTYLFTPPALMTYDHFPEDAKWQLRTDSISLGDFVRQPLLSPAIGALGLSLVSPTRSQITVSGEATIVLANPRAAAVAANARRDGSPRSETGKPCKVALGVQTTITCSLSAGEYEVEIFAAPARATMGGEYVLDYVGSILVNSR